MENELWNEMQKLKKLKLLENGNWSFVRNFDKFKKTKVKFGSEDRDVLLDCGSNEYLQASRGLSLHKYNSVSEVLDDIKQKIDNLDDFKKQRIDEVEQYLLNNSLKISNFIELGFRFPILLNYFSKKHVPSWGYDIVRSNVLVSKLLGFNVEVLDLNNIVEKIDLKFNSLIVCYHVLEHLTDPYQSLKMIYNSMDQESLLHLEVPIQNNINIQAAHLSFFKSGDLLQMLNNIGYNVIFYNKVETGERCLVKRS